VAILVRVRVENPSELLNAGLFGAGALFGFIRLSQVLKLIERDIQGRMVVFFPGHKDGNNYRLLDARDGWNYLAVAITLQGEGGPE